jgi:TldD protein
MSISRRSFLRTASTAAAGVVAMPLIKNSFFSLRAAESPGYFQKEFGITESLWKKTLEKALAKGGDYADLYFEHTINNYLILEDGKVNRAYTDISLGVGIRTVKDDQVGYGFTQELDEKSILAAAATAASIASSGKGPAIKSFTKLQTANYYPIDKLLTEVPVESKLPIVYALNEKCFSLASNIIKVNVSYMDQQKRITVVTSDGVVAEDILPRNYLSVSVLAEKDGKKERAGHNLGGRKSFSFYTTDVVNKIAEEAVSNVQILFEAVQPPAGEIPVVLGTGVTGILLHEAIGHGMEADFNRKKISTYSDMIGKKVAEPEVTILDDATNIGLPGAINFDDEGTPGQKTVLVDKGILSSFMHDKISAKHYKLKSTGNGRRESYQHYVMPRMRNTYMLSGSSDPDEIIKSVDKGIYVEKVSNGQVQIGEGDFAFYVSQGRLIENGKKTVPIKDINIMGNGPKMLANVIMVGNDLKMSESGGGQCGKNGQGVPVGFGMPTLLVKSMTVGGVR